MTNSLTLKSAVNLTDQFVEKAFELGKNENNQLEGSKIPGLTPFKEFNFILLYILLQSWKNDAKKLRSPYFDFENTEVKQALEKFMNVVSNHILIEKNNFLPLGKKSFQLTLLYFNDVLGFISEVFSNKVTQTELRELNKFLKGDGIESLLEFMTSESEDELTISEIDVSSVARADKDSFLKALEKFLNSENLKEEETASQSSSDSKPYVPQSGNTINEINKDHSKKASLNETLKPSGKEEGKVLAETLSSDKSIDRIQNAIPLNQKLLIVKTVFNNDNDDYNFFIDSLENAEDYKSAKHILKSNIQKEEYFVQYEFLKDVLKNKFKLESD